MWRTVVARLHTVVVLALLGGACESPSRAYEGPERPRDEVALIKVSPYSRTSDTSHFSNRLVSVDGCKCTNDKRAYVLPGRSTVEVYWYYSGRATAYTPRSLDKLAGGYGATYKMSASVGAKQEGHLTVELDTNAGGRYLIRLSTSEGLPPQFEIIDESGTSVFERRYID